MKDSVTCQANAVIIRVFKGQVSKTRVELKESGCWG